MADCENDSREKRRERMNAHWSTEDSSHKYNSTAYDFSNCPQEEKFTRIQENQQFNVQRKMNLKGPRRRLTILLQESSCCPTGGVAVSRLGVGSSGSFTSLDIMYFSGQPARSDWTRQRRKAPAVLFCLKTTLTEIFTPEVLSWLASTWLMCIIVQLLFDSASITLYGINT